MAFRVRTEFNQFGSGGSNPNPLSPAIPLTPGPFGLDLVPRPPAPVAPPPPVIAAPPAPPPVAPPPVVPPIVTAPPIAPPPVAPAPPVADPVIVATNPVATDPAPSAAPVDAAPPSDPFNPASDAGNQGLQAQEAGMVGDNPAIPEALRTAPFAPTDNTDIFNPGVQTQVGQENTPPDNNPAPDANQGGGGEPATLLATSASVNQGEPPDVQNDIIASAQPGDTVTSNSDAQNPVDGGEAPLLLATNLAASQGEVPVTPDSGNTSDPLQSIQQAGQDLNAASGEAAQNVNDLVTQANDSIQQAPQSEPSAVVNTEPPSNDASPPTPEPDPAINGAAEVGRAVLSAVPVVGPVVSAGEAIAGQTITGRELSAPERIALGASAALGAIPVAQGAKAALAVGKSGLLAAAGTAAEGILSSPALGAQVSGAVTRGFEAGTADQTDPQALDNVEQQALVAQFAGNAAGAVENPVVQSAISGVGNTFQQNIGDTDPPNNLQDVANFAIGAATGGLPNAAKAGAGQLAEQLVANADSVGLPLASEVGNAIEKVATASAGPVTEFLSNVPTDAVNDATAEGSQLTEGIKETVNNVDNQVQSDFENLVNPVPVAP